MIRHSQRSDALVYLRMQKNKPSVQDFINFGATLKHEKNVKNEIKSCQNWPFLAKNGFKVARIQRVLN